MIGKPLELWRDYDTDHWMRGGDIFVCGDIAKEYIILPEVVRQAWVTAYKRPGKERIKATLGPQGGADCQCPACVEYCFDGQREYIPSGFSAWLMKCGLSEDSPVYLEVEYEA